MKIRSVDVKISAISLTVFFFFTFVLVSYVLLTGDSSILFWGIPSLILLVIFPMGLNYMSQKQYKDLIPVYEKEAKKVTVRAININMLGEPVKVQGVVEAARFKFLNRPQYMIADKTGVISAKMFTQPSVDVEKGDIVEVMGSIIKRYVLAGEPVINCVSIKKIR